MNYKGYLITITEKPYATRLELDRPVVITDADGFEDRFTSVEQAQGTIDLMASGQYAAAVNPPISRIEAQIMGATRYTELPASTELS